MPVNGPSRGLVQFLATAAYIGYLPWFPGTWASVFTAALVLAWQPEKLAALFWLWGVVVVGVWAATGYDRVYKTHDAGAIVIDEVVGQGIALFPLLILRETSVGWYTVAVILFRFFDICKPLGIDRLQRLPAGFGVMADDILAGLYAAILLVGGIWIKTLL